MKNDKVSYIKRRNFFVDKKFQTRFIVRFCILVIFACLVFGTLVYFLSLQSITTTFENSRLVVKSTADYLFPLLTLTSLITIALIGLATIFVVLFISHKIAGPAYRFRRIIREIAQGNLGLDVRVRSGDQFQQIASGLDEMVKSLRLQILKIKEKVSELNNTYSKLKESQGEKIKVDLIDLERVINEVNKEVSYFKL